MAEMREMADQAQGRAQDAAGQARARMREQVDRRSTQAGEQVASTAEDVRSVAEELRRQGKDSPARYADRAADGVERLGGYLRESDGDRILRDVEDFGRRQPWAVVAGGLALGFAASRMLKASSRDRYRSLGDRSGERALPTANGGEPAVGAPAIGDAVATRPVAPGTGA